MTTTALRRAPDVSPQLFQLNSRRPFENIVLFPSIDSVRNLYANPSIPVKVIRKALWRAARFVKATRKIC